MNLPHYLYQRYIYQGLDLWVRERLEMTARLHNSEPSQFAERCLDSYAMNWYIQSLEIFFPKFKRIFVDQRSEDLFKAIDSSKE